jgi:hypothetical protein
MKKTVIIVLIGVLLFLGLSSGALYARDGRHGGFHGGFHRGWYGFGPWWGYPYAYPYYGYPYPYYYPYDYPYPAYPSATLPVPGQPQQSYWYYCRDPEGYYPYVASCPGGWVQVVPTPPPGKERAAQ